MKILAVIPAFNEQKNISEVVLGTRKYISDVLVIDDASTDSTCDEAYKAGAVVIRHPYNLGPAVAYQTGYKYALSHGYSQVVQLDGDGQHDPDDIPDLLALLEKGVALGIGSRFSGVGKYAMPKLRLFGKTFFSALIRWLTGHGIADPTSGFRAFTKPVLELFVTDIFADEYPDADMLILALRFGHIVGETGVSMRHSNTGKSIHAGILGPAYYMLRMSIGIFSAYFVKVEK
jgi:glycosyltransferase involved in cell wall biosynthesis